MKWSGSAWRLVVFAFTARLCGFRQAGCVRRPRFLAGFTYRCCFLVAFELNGAPQSVSHVPRVSERCSSACFTHGHVKLFRNGFVHNNMITTQRKRTSTSRALAVSYVSPLRCTATLCIVRPLGSRLARENKQDGEDGSAYLHSDPHRFLPPSDVLKRIHIYSGEFSRSCFSSSGLHSRNAFGGANSPRWQSVYLGSVCGFVRP